MHAHARFLTDGDRITPYFRPRQDSPRRRKTAIVRGIRRCEIGTATNTVHGLIGGRHTRLDVDVRGITVGLRPSRESQLREGRVVHRARDGWRRIGYAADAIQVAVGWKARLARHVRRVAGRRNPRSHPGRSQLSEVDRAGRKGCCVVTTHAVDVPIPCRA